MLSGERYTNKVARVWCHNVVQKLVHTCRRGHTVLKPENTHVVCARHPMEACGAHIDAPVLDAKHIWAHIATAYWCEQMRVSSFDGTKQIGTLFQRFVTYAVAVVNKCGKAFSKN